MSWCNINNLSSTLGDLVLFQNLSVSLKKSAKIGLVGQNGAGKSTLLNLIHERLSLDLSVKVGYIRQKCDFDLSQNVFEYLMALEINYWEILVLLETQMSCILNPNQVFGDLSGGELQKLKIALELYKKPDLLLLDEISNNLDLESVAEVLNILKKFHGAIICVSHDSDLLNNLCEIIWELENADLKIFGGDFDFYFTQKQLADTRRVELYLSAKQDLELVKQIKKDQDLKSKTRLVKGQKDGQKSGLGKAEQNFFKNKSEVKSGQKKIQFEQLLQQKELILDQNRVFSKKDIHFKFATNSVKTTKLISLKKCDLKVGKDVLVSNLDLELSFGQKILISGRNGTGKSSLIYALVDLINPKSGFSDYKITSQAKENIYISQNPKYVFLDQKYDLIDLKLSLEQNLLKVDPDLNITQLYQMLAYFGFNHSQSAQKADTLSGGERVRLALACICLSSIDLLILDEPTNNLDLSTLKVLVKVLQKFQGSIVLISHNDWFNQQFEFSKKLKIENRELITMSLK